MDERSRRKDSRVPSRKKYEETMKNKMRPTGRKGKIGVPKREEAMQLVQGQPTARG